MKYDLEIGQIVYWKCKVIELKTNCVVTVKGANVGEQSIKFTTHPNSLITYNEQLNLTSPVDRA